MADSFVISDTTYAGEAAANFIMPAITGADTIDGGHAYVKDGIKKRFTIPRWSSDYSTMIQDRMATPTSQGTMTVTGQALNPADYMIYMEFNPRDFETHWYSQEMMPALLDAQLPYNANSVVVMGVMQRHAKFFNRILWNGDTTTTGIMKYFDGWIRRGKTSATSNKVASTTISATNVADELLKVYNAIPLALRYDPNMKIFVSYATFDFYTTFQTTTQVYKGVDVTQQGVPTFRGKEVVKIADFPDNTMIAAKGMNTTESALWAGINSVSDEGLKFAPLQANSEYWFVKLLMKADVNYAWDDEIVYYGTL
jgi:hypothetical protein